jgi:hypothetical protein
MAKRGKTRAIVYRDWKQARAYKTEQDIPCAGYQCGGTITTGDLYTRHKPYASFHVHNVHPFCRACFPFVEVQGEQVDVWVAYAQTPMYQTDVKERQPVVFGTFFAELPAQDVSQGE